MKTRNDTDEVCAETSRPRRPRAARSAELPPVESTHSLSERIDVEITDGSAIAFSDQHYDPEAPASTAHRAVVHLAKSLKPALLICGGDACDFSGIARHPRIMWEQQPKPVDEIAIVQQRLREIERAAPKARRVWTIGNHDQRLSSYLAQNAPQLEGIHGACLSDFFPSWEMTWAAWINPQAQIPCVVKHRWHGGVNACRANVQKSGTHIVTGHTHHAGMVPLTDWQGTRWGVHLGCVADVNSRLFAAYTEKGCTGWRSGAAVLQFAADGEMLPPELVLVQHEDPRPGSGTVWFLGRLIAV